MAKSEPSLKSSVWDLERNDVQSCVALYESRVARGATVSPSERRAMIKLQDDPKELLKIMAGWSAR